MKKKQNKPPVDPNAPLWVRCDLCSAHFAGNPMLVEALASVGITHNKSSHEMAVIYFADFHEKGHFAQ